MIKLSVVGIWNRGFPSTFPLEVSCMHVRLHVCVSVLSVLFQIAVVHLAYECSGKINQGPRSNYFNVSLALQYMLHDSSSHYHNITINTILHFSGNKASSITEE